MNNFKPGGLRHRKDDLGGRPRSDADYSTKKRFDKKPNFESRGNGGGNRYENRGPKEMQLFSATCTTCGNKCEVPFKPDGTKPVLCRDCFAKKNSAPGNFERNDRPSYDRKPERNFDAPRPQSAPGVTKADLEQLTKKLSAIETVVAELLTIVKTRHAEHTAHEVTEVAEVAKPVAPKEKKAPAKKVAAKKAAKKAVKKTAKDK